MSIGINGFYWREKSGTRRRRHGSAIVAAAVLTLVAAGCAPQNGNTASDTAVKSATSTGGSTTVHIGFFPNVTHAAALVGTGRGTFAKAFGNGVSVEEKTFTAGPAEIEALFAGAVDIGYIGPGPAVNGYLKSNGDALQIIAGASSGGAALVATQKSGVTSIVGLAGKTVAVPQTGGTQDISLRHALTEAKLAPTEKGGTVTVVQYAPADVETQMKAGTVQAAWLPEPWVSRLVDSKTAAVVVDERDRWPSRKFATTVVVVRSAFLKEHADLVAKFVGANAETVAWINAHPDEARKVLGDRIAAITKKPLPDAVLKSALAHTDITADPLKDSVLTFADWSHDLGYLKQDRSALGGLFYTAPAAAAKVAAK